MGVPNGRMIPSTEDRRDLVLDGGSRDNIELVREHVEAYVRRDVEAMRRLCSADLSLDWSASKGWLADVYRGFEEVVRFYADYYAHFEEILIETESYTSTGDHVVVPNIAYQRGRDGIVVTARSTFVFTVRDCTSRGSACIRRRRRRSKRWAWSGHPRRQTRREA
jgi:ketosteroid isomerase-like protein